MIAQEASIKAKSSLDGLLVCSARTLFQERYLLPRQSLGPPWKGRYAHPISASSGPSHLSGRNSMASWP